MTHASMVFYASLEQAQFIAECAGLRLIFCPNSSPYKTEYAMQEAYHSWEDKATGGGGCRITWIKGMAWVSNHSGYPHADITQEVADLFAEIGCQYVTSAIAHYSPRIYGLDKFCEAAELDYYEVNRETWK